MSSMGQSLVLASRIMPTGKKWRIGRDVELMKRQAANFPCFCYPPSVGEPFLLGRVRPANAVMANPCAMASIRTRHGSTGRFGNTENRENRHGGRLPQNKGNQLKKTARFPPGLPHQKTRMLFKRHESPFCPSHSLREPSRCSAVFIRPIDPPYSR